MVSHWHDLPSALILPREAQALIPEARPPLRSAARVWPKGFLVPRLAVASWVSWFPPAAAAEPADPAGAEPDLCALLAGRWKAYRKALRRCRDRADEEAVHDLRVEIRRLLAVLELAAAVAPEAKLKKLRRHLRRRLKRLSGLRDLHVQLGLLAPEARRSTGLREFRAKLEAEAARLAARQERSFRCLRLRRLHRRFARVQRAAAARTATPRRARAAAALLQKAFARSVARVMARRAALDAARPETLHRLRVALKRQRYMAEAVARLNLGADDSRPAALRELQRRLGRIQDLDVLLRRVEAFARGTVDSRPFTALAGRLRRRRDGLARAFVSSFGVRLRGSTLPGPRQGKGTASPPAAQFR